MTGDPVTLAPFGVGSAASQQVHNLIYESLVNWDENLNVVPGLAVSWTTPDRHTYIFKLRKGVRFHSGKELDSSDVVYSFTNQAKPPAPGTVNTFYPRVASVQAIDKYTVRFTMSQSDGTLLGYCAWLQYSFIVPNGFYQSTSNPSSQADGTGPFKLVEYVPNDHISLARHTSYWRAGLPYLDSLTLKVLPDEQTRLIALTSGALDGTWLSTDNARPLHGNSSLVVQAGTTTAYREMQFTLRDRTKPWFNVLVRKAINRAIDRTEILNKVYSGQGRYSGFIPPSYGDWGISTRDLHSTWQRYDLAEAQKLMKLAGQSSGFSVTLESLNTLSDLANVAQVIAAQLAKINIKVTVSPLQQAQFSQHNLSGNFEWNLTARGMRGDPTQYFSDFVPGASTYLVWFQGGYRNDRLTNLLARAIAQTEVKKRHTLINSAQKIVLGQWPAMPLVIPVTYQVLNKRVQNMYLAIDGTMRGLAEAWVTS
jgi:peptide/nickel transport system substrate-binding protein